MGTLRPTAVLLVDDDEDLRGVLVRALAALGHEVATAGTAGRALELLSRKPFDVLVSDLRLPDMNGAEFVRRVRAAGNQVPAVVISGYAGCLEASRLRECGVSAVLSKPVGIAEFTELVAGIAGGVRPAGRSEEGARACRAD